ncbi:hypothetical protein Tco_0558114 [Tanacetum coccineum]
MKATMAWRCRACDGFDERLLVCSLSFKNNVFYAPDDELTQWTSAKVKRRMLKSLNWTVKGVDESKVYEIREQKNTCLRSVDQLAKPWFLNANIKGTYAGIIYPLQDVSSWHTPHDFPLVLPPILGKNLPGRPKKKDRIPSQGEGRINNKCGRCGAQGHNRTRCNVPLPKKQTNGSKRMKSTHVPSVYKESQAHQEHQQPNQDDWLHVVILINYMLSVEVIILELDYDSPHSMNSDDTWEPRKVVIKNTSKSVSVKGRIGSTSKKVSCSKSTKTKPFKDLKFFDDSSSDDQGNVFRGKPGRTSVYSKGNKHSVSKKGHVRKKLHVQKVLLEVNS